MSFDYEFENIISELECVFELMNTSKKRDFLDQLITVLTQVWDDLR